MSLPRSLFAPSLLRALVGRTLVVAVLALAALAAAAIYESDRLIVGQFTGQAQLVARTATSEIGRQAALMTADASLLASLPTLRDLTQARDPARLNAFLLDVKRALDVDYLSVADASGRVLASAQGFAPGATLPAGLLAVAGGDTAKSWALSDEADGLVIRAVAEVRGSDSSVIGLVQVGSVLGEQYLADVKATSDAQIALVWQGAVRASTIALPDTSAFPTLTDVEAAGGQAVRDVRVGGADYYGIFSVVRSDRQTPGLLLVMVPKDQVVAAQLTLIGIVVGVALVLGVIIAYFALLTARRMTRPLGDLAAAAQRIEAGDFSVRVPERSAHEIGTLERAFDTMASSLDDRERARREYVDEVRTVNEVADAIVGVTDRERIFTESLGRLVHLTKAAGAAIVIRADAPGAPPGSGGRLVAPHTLDMDPDAAAAVAARILVREVQDPNTIHELHVPAMALPHLAAIPLSARGRAVGLLAVAYREKHEITESEARGFRTIARLVSVAKENADLVNELRDGNLQLERANRLKSEFLASVSHELRTPMNAIIGYTKLMLDGLDGELTEQQQADLTRVAQAAENLLGLINGILDLAKIEAGRMELNAEELDMRELVGEALELMKPSADAKSLRLVMDVPADLPPAWADRARVRQVLVNLLGNAVKFTDSGGVTVAVSSAEGWLTTTVRDTGVGMPKEALSYVFDEFRQADSSTTRRYGGTGLGLAISKRLIALHGGSIWADSAPGEGSVFSFTLPVRVRPASSETGYAAARPRQRQAAAAERQE